MLLEIQMVEQFTMNMKQGTDQNKNGTITAITSNIVSGDFDITQRVFKGTQTGMPDFRGDGEFIMKIRRFVPDFISQTGNTQSYITIKKFSK